jgi:xanthine dehydrogenase YagT iron-sulfur-binding subunit
MDCWCLSTKAPSKIPTMELSVCFSARTDSPQSLGGEHNRIRVGKHGWAGHSPTTQILCCRNFASRLDVQKKVPFNRFAAPRLRAMQKQNGGRGMASSNDGMSKSAWSRRNFLATSMVSTMSVTFLDRPSASAAPATTPDPHAPYATTINVNGQRYHLALDVRTTLHDALRDHIGLTGSKKRCDHGRCGACTVMVDDRRVLSCLTLVASIEDRNVTTIEGLSQADGRLHPMQQAFIDHDAFDFAQALADKS